MSVSLKFSKKSWHLCSCFGCTSPYSKLYNVPFNSTSQRHRLDGTSIAVDCHLKVASQLFASSTNLLWKELTKNAEDNPSWCLDQSFEKMLAIMTENHGKLVGLYECSCHVFRSKGLLVLDTKNRCSGYEEQVCSYGILIWYDILGTLMLL